MKKIFILSFIAFSIASCGENSEKSHKPQLLKKIRGHLSTEIVLTRRYHEVDKYAIS